MTEWKLPDVRQLDHSLLPHGLNLSIRALRRRAKDLGECYGFARKIFVTPEQLTSILESYRSKPLRPFVPPRRLPPPAHRVSVKEKKQFDAAVRRLSEAISKKVP